jgi:hypothetical protein
MNITCWNAYPEWHNRWWEPKTVALRKQFGELFKEEFDKITHHFSKLEESMVKEGFHHPISAVTGKPRDIYLKKPREVMHFPPETHNNLDGVIYSHTFGGSRLSVAAEHDILVPCAVHDFSNLFEDCPEITAHNYKTWFGNNYMFCGATPHLRLTKHSHITDVKYSGMNAATKDAKRAAVKAAKERLRA